MRDSGPKTPFINDVEQICVSLTPHPLSLSKMAVLLKRSTGSVTKVLNA